MGQTNGSFPILLSQFKKRKACFHLTRNMTSTQKTRYGLVHV